MNSDIQMVHFNHLHTGQLTIAAHPARFKVVACGRRWGKTELAKTILTERACHRGQVTWWLAPTYAMATQVWRDLKTTTANLTGRRVSESDKRIDFNVSGGSISIHSTHYPDNLRGAGLDYVVLDEAAFMPPTVWGDVVRPMLLERRGGALFLSTPFGKNWFYRLYLLGDNPHEPAWASFRFKSMDNPLIAPEEFATIRRQTTERVWQTEYLAHFVDDAGQVFRGVRTAATAPPHPTPDANRRYIMGVDWAREQDYTALVVIDAERAQMVALERFHQVSWSAQLRRVQALYDRWQPTVIWAESNSVGSPLIEQLQQEGLPVRPFVTTNRSKTQLIEGLALAIERGELALLPDETLLQELSLYSMERLAGGRYRYSAPAGQHDDTVIATALAWHGVNYGGVRVDFA